MFPELVVSGLYVGEGRELVNPWSGVCIHRKPGTQSRWGKLDFAAPAIMLVAR